MSVRSTCQGRVPEVLDADELASDLELQSHDADESRCVTCLFSVDAISFDGGWCTVLYSRMSREYVSGSIV